MRKEISTTKDAKHTTKWKSFAHDPQNTSKMYNFITRWAAKENRVTSLLMDVRGEKQVASITRPTNLIRFILSRQQGCEEMKEDITIKINSNTN